MNRNLLLTVVLSVGVLLGWQAIMARFYPASKTPAPPAAPPSAAPAQPRSETLATPESPVPLTRRLVEYDFGDNRVTFNLTGAGVAQWAIHTKGRWIELIPPDHSEDPLSLFPGLGFKVERPSPQEVVFTGMTTEGLVVRKTYLISPGNALHTVRLSLSNQSGAPLEGRVHWGWSSGLVPGSEMAAETGRGGKSVHHRPVQILDGQRLFKVKEGTADLSGRFKWWAVDSHYFVAAFLNQGDDPIKLTVEEKEDYTTVKETIGYSLAPGAALEDTLHLYVGPKSYSQLSALGWQLERVVDFGWFDSIGRFLTKTLYLLHNFTHNYGWAIVLLTLGIQAILLPLTVNSFRHGQRMKLLQPQLKRIQELYKNDPRRLNSEMMALYKRHNIKFMGMGGCLPLLLQMPVFVALYNTLNSSYELFGEPWVGWIRDLSSHDPYYVMPIANGLIMLGQMKVTSSSLPPEQARIMYIMPLVFTVMFIKMPAGLVLYWCTSSLISMLIQFILLKSHAAQKPEEVRA